MTRTSRSNIHNQPNRSTGCSATSSPTPRISSAGATACGRPGTRAGRATSGADSSCTWHRLPQLIPCRLRGELGRQRPPQLHVPQSRHRRRRPGRPLPHQPQRQNQHDVDLCTIHRVRDFRSLAMDLWRTARELAAHFAHCPSGRPGAGMTVDVTNDPPATRDGDCRELLCGSALKP